MTVRPRIIQHSIPTRFFDAARAWFNARLDDLAIIRRSISGRFFYAERALIHADLHDGFDMSKAAS